jgi:hypothetical protein
VPCDYSANHVNLLRLCHVQQYTSE